MNVYIIIGIILTAIGTLILTYGGVVHSRKDAESSQKIADEQYYEISKDLAELKGIPKAELSYDAVRKMEENVQNWAQSFVSERDRLTSIQNLKLDQEGRRLESVERLSRDYFHFLINILSQAIRGYNQKLATKITSNLPELDSNLFGNNDSRFEGSITFPSGISWNIRAYSTEPGPEIASPIVLIDKTTTKSTVGKTEFQLRFGKNMERYHIRLQGDFKLSYGEGTLNGVMPNYEDNIKDVLRNLIEAEIIGAR